jgi:hypothetical protein
MSIGIVRIVNRAVMAAALLLGACGGGGDGGGPDAAPGTLTIRGNDITGATGKIVLATVTAAGGGAPLGGICVSVTDDPMSFAAVAQTPAAGNPCDLGANVTFASGDYDVTAGLYTPGSQTAELCANTTVSIPAATEVTLPALAACP